MPDRKYARTSLKTLLEQYLQVLIDSPLTDSSVNSYYTFARSFVLWANGEYEPGQVNRKRKPRELTARRLCNVCGGEGEHDWEVHSAEMRANAE